MPKFDDPTTWPADYAPGLHHPKGRKPAWRAPERYVKAGWTPARVEVPEGEETPVCRRLTRELLQWWAKQEINAEYFGTWRYVIRRFRTDNFSKYANCKQNTRDGYDWSCDKWDKAIGHLKIEALDFEMVKTIERAMRDKGRSDAYVHRMMNHLRIVVNHGALIRDTQDACLKPKFVMENVTFPAPKPRSVAPTRKQVEAVVAVADAAGDFLIATGWLMQFELCLRSVDVRGQWLADTGEAGGIVKENRRRGYPARRWQDGLTWEMFEGSVLSKVISKTAKSMPDPYVWDLDDIPYLRDRIARIRPGSAVGPVFVTKSGLPFDQLVWAQTWRKYARKAGVPDEVRVADLRAGGITEARSLGVSEFDLRDAAQHTSLKTTGRYVRDKSTAAGNVVKIRPGARK